MFQVYTRGIGRECTDVASIFSPESSDSSLAFVLPPTGRFRRGLICHSHPRSAKTRFLERTRQVASLLFCWLWTQSQICTVLPRSSHHVRSIYSSTNDECRKVTYRCKRTAMPSTSSFTRYTVTLLSTSKHQIVSRAQKRREVRRAANPSPVCRAFPLLLPCFLWQ